MGETEASAPHTCVPELATQAAQMMLLLILSTAPHPRHPPILETALSLLSSWIFSHQHHPQSLDCSAASRYISSPDQSLPLHHGESEICLQVASSQMCLPSTRSHALNRTRA